MYSIRLKILSIAFASLTIIGTAFFIYSMTTTANYKKMRMENIERKVAYETTKVNKIIAEIERSAIFYAIAGFLSYELVKYDFMKLMDFSPGRIGRRMVVEYINSFPDLMGGGFWFEPYAYRENQLRAGFYTFFDNESGTIKTESPSFIDDYDYHNTIWYREIVENLTQPHQVIWTKPYADDSVPFSLITTASSGIFKEDGTLIGISTADWRIEEVVRELVAVKPTENSFIILCVPERDYVISSTRTNDIIGVSMQDIPWDITASSFYLDGINYMRFGRNMDNGWLLSIQIPVYEIFAEAERHNERFTVILVIVFVMILLLVYIITSVLINAPIKKLTLGVSQIAFGNLDSQIDISSKDEIGLLAKVFNKMTIDLKESIEENAVKHAEKERIRAELNVAATIQSSMLPCNFPPFPDRNEFDLYASIVPAKEVCGDFYDFFFIDKDNLVVVIADVSGKGIPAALFMVIAKTLIKNCSSCRTPQCVAESVNKKLCEGNETGMFVTAFIGFYNIPTRKFTFVNAGHNPPLIKKNGSPFEYLNTNPCIIMGFMEDAEYREEEIYLEDGDILYLYTDGITEAINPDYELFGEQRFLDSVNKYGKLSLQEILRAIKRDVKIFSEGAEQADDITMLALKITDNKQRIINGSEKTANATVEIPADGKELFIQAKVENLKTVIDFIDSEILSCNYSSVKKNEINLAVEEIFINISKYAYGKPGGEVCVNINTNEKTVIKFTDTGKAYNPLEQPLPDFEKSPAERNIGGLGIFLVKKLMDSVDYYREDGKNILVITKENL